MSSLTDQLKALGFKPEANTDGEFKPLVGTYAATIQTLRSEIDTKNDNAKFYQLEIKPNEVIEGETFGEKFLFKRRYYVDGDKAAENLKKLINDMFTAGVELDTSSDAALEASFEKAIGAACYVRSWGWTPKDKTSPTQMFVIQKAAVAEKKRATSTSAIPF